MGEMKFKKIRNEITSEIRKEKKAFEEKLADKIKIDPKSFYSYVRSKSKTKCKVGPLKDSKGALITDMEEMAEILNKSFASMFTKENFENIPDMRSMVNSRGILLMDIVFNEEKVYAALQKLAG